jgi:hypothetical protein
MWELAMLDRIRMIFLKNRELLPFRISDDALCVILFYSILVYLVLVYFVEFLLSFVDLTQVPYFKEIRRRQVPVRCLGIL